jgi:transposase
MDVTDDQWRVLEPLIGELPKRADGRGRSWRSSREVLSGILWILRAVAQWADLPQRYPPYQTCHRRFQRWAQDGTYEWILEALARHLKDRGKMDLSECFIDGTFVVAKKADAWDRPSGARVRSLSQWQTVLVFFSPLVPPRLRPIRRFPAAGRPLRVPCAQLSRLSPRRFHCDRTQTGFMRPLLCIASYSGWQSQ